MSKKRATKKRKIVRVGSMSVTRQATRRNKYPEVRGKVVDWIEQSEEDGFVSFTIGFTDGTYFDVTCGTTMVQAYYADMSSGDEVRLKEYRKFRP
jgi:hypothetical protein